VQTFLDGLFVEKPATPKMLRCGPVMYELAKANSDTKKSLLGCNLLEETPSISRWLRDCVEDENVVLNKQKMTVGNYTYLDGELHVRLSVACNEIILHLCQDNAHIKIAFLCTPTDCHLIPKVAYQAAEMNLQNAPWWMSSMSGCFGLKKNLMLPVPSHDQKNIYYMVDGIVGQQGPNYALAKRMQHWLAIKQRQNGHTVASNVAPSTATVSVTHNFLFKMAYGGMHFFKPMEVMWPCTSNALMGALLLHDMSNESGPKRGAVGSDHFSNPLELFSTQGVHGGLWRTGYSLNSTGTLSAILYLLTNYHYVLVPLLSFLIVAFSWLGGVPGTDAWDPLMRGFGWVYASGPLSTWSLF